MAGRRCAPRTRTETRRSHCRRQWKDSRSLPRWLLARSGVAALGIELSELFSDNGVAPRILAEYDYRNENDELLFQVVRYEPKGFRQRRPDGKGGYIWNLNGVARVLYGLPDVLKAKSVLVVEGEKDVATGNALGLTATCNAGGAGKWGDYYSESLRGKRIVVIADGDEPGRKHAAQVAASLAGKVESLKVLELRGSKDLSDWVERGGTREPYKSDSSHAGVESTILH